MQGTYFLKFERRLSTFLRETAIEKVILNKVCLLVTKPYLLFTFNNLFITIFLVQK